MQAHTTALADWLIVLPVLLPLLGAALLLMLNGRLLPPIIPALAVALLVILGNGFLLARILATGPVSMTMGRWLPPFGISFTADLTGAFFALLGAAAIFGVLVAMAGAAPEKPRQPGYFALVLLLLAGVGGAFLTGDLFNLYVWFEVMLIASFGLLGFSGTKLALDGTLKYGVLNLVATSLFLVALGLIYGALGTLNMADAIAVAPTAPPGIMTAIAALIVVALGIKAAAFPFNAWLPAAYHAPPAVVSALLGGLLTKVGLYALLRILVLVLPASRDALGPVLAVLAATTLLLAPLGAIAETNLRRAIGYFLIGGIGSVLAGMALPIAIGISGAVVYIATAVLTVTALYLAAGLIERRTGTTDTREMGGLYAADSPLSLLFGLLVVSVAGVPPFLGFWPKLLLVQAGVERAGLTGGAVDPFALPLAACLLLNALLTLFAGARLWSHIFWRPASRPLAGGAGEGGGNWGLVATMGFGAVILMGGLLPGPMLAIGRLAAAALLDSSPYVAAVGLGGAP